MRARARVNAAPGGEEPAFPPSEVGRVERLGANELSPRLTGVDELASRVMVTLPLLASGAFHVDDRSSSAGIDVAMEGASDATAEVADGLVIYRDGVAPGAHVIHRVTSEGTEDYVMLGAEIAPSLACSLELRRGIAGLRLVASTLEMVDAAGVPRLRVPPPYVLGADGVRRDAKLAVERCAYDTDPRAPWDHAVVAPGSTHCSHRPSFTIQPPTPGRPDPAWHSRGRRTR